MNTEIILIRHGEPVLQNALLGSTDSPLSENGWSQLEKTFGSIGPFDQLISSPLTRCAGFAQHLGSESNVPLAIEEAWKECHFGDWDGQTYQSLHQNHPQQVSQFFSEPDKFPPPNAERLSEFSSRIEQAISQIYTNYTGKKVAILTHAGVIRTVVAWCLKMDYRSGLQFRRFSVDYASATRVSIYQDDKIYPQLMSLNHCFDSMEPHE
ncbi:MAG: histidine phosphatase family protein [Kangiellaceae bacterium]|nr:histidine phosphatase family protein [Kangiellaceae bacterium]MCW8999648.1 histidine phosphatase family protein [Kangiellaceae bacterium]